MSTRTQPARQSVRPLRHAVLAMRAGVVGVALALSTACSTGPVAVTPPAPDSGHYLPAGDPAISVEVSGQVQRFDAGAELRADWWRLFGNPQLDDAIARALRQSPGMAAAQATLERSQASLAAGKSVFWPQLDLDGAAARERLTPARQGIAGAGSVFNLYTLALSVGYSVDLFGAHRHAVEGLQAQVDVDCEGLRAAQLSLTGNLASALLAAAAYRDQLATLDTQLELQRQQIGLLEARSRAGLVPATLLMVAQAQLADLQATQAALRQRLSASEDLAAVLAGDEPGLAQATVLGLEQLQLPADLPLSVPSQLVRQRPDILVATARLRGASADVGVATAQQYPDLTLSGGFGRGALTPQALRGSSGDYWSGGADLHQTVFQAGAASDRRRAAEAEYRAADASYRQTVLSSLEQVADTLAALDQDARAAQARRTTLDSALSQLTLAEVNQRTGRSANDDLLTARQVVEADRLNWQAAQGSRLQDVVALFVAMGGGWWPAQRCGEPQPGGSAR